MQINKRFFCFKIDTLDQDINFIIPADKFAVDENRKFKTRLTLLEVKSEIPPTECKMIIKDVGNNNEIEVLIIDFVQYRKMFSFENGFYTCDLGFIPLFSDRLFNLHTIQFQNERDPNCEVRLYCELIKPTI